MNLVKAKDRILINLDNVEEIVVESNKLTFYFGKNEYRQIAYKSEEEAKEELAKISREFGKVWGEGQGTPHF